MYKSLVKVTELTHQLEVLKEIHDRHMDRKNAAIANLRRDLMEADEQFETAVQAQCVNTDTLIDIQMSRLDTLRSQFDSDMATLEAEFNTERSGLFMYTLFIFHFNNAYI